MDEWTAEVDVTVALAGALVAQRFPEFAGARVEPFGEGWDNAAFLVGGTHVFRFPRRAVAAPLIETEARILPSIAPRLPQPIPVPQWVGGASASYPWAFTGYRLIAGTPLSAVRPSDDASVTLARALGEFLRALHAIDVAPLLAAGLPPDQIGRLDHAQRMPKLHARFAELRAAGLIEDPQPFVDALEAVAPAGSRALVVCHGDLYARHLLVDEANALAGVIDWGDVHHGDPAVDVSVAFEVVPPHARAAFFKAYGMIDARTRELARYRAIYHAALVAHYGYRIGDEDLLRAGLTGLEYAAAD